jgi:hypothetical protein
MIASSDPRTDETYCLSNGAGVKLTPQLLQTSLLVCTFLAFPLARGNNMQGNRSLVLRTHKRIRASVRDLALVQDASVRSIAFGRIV